MILFISKASKTNVGCWVHHCLRERREAFSKGFFFWTQRQQRRCAYSVAIRHVPDSRFAHFSVYHASLWILKCLEIKRQIAHWTVRRFRSDALGGKAVPAKWPCALPWPGSHVVAPGAKALDQDGNLKSGTPPHWIPGVSEDKHSVPSHLNVHHCMRKFHSGAFTFCLTCEHKHLESEALLQISPQEAPKTWDTFKCARTSKENANWGAALRLLRSGCRAARARAGCDWCCLAAGRGGRREIWRAGGGGKQPAGRGTGSGRRQDGETDGGADRAGGAVHQRRAGPRAGPPGWVRGRGWASARRPVVSAPPRARRAGAWPAGLHCGRQAGLRQRLPALSPDFAAGRPFLGLSGASDGPSPTHTQRIDWALPDPHPCASVRPCSACFAVWTVWELGKCY